MWKRVAVDSQKVYILQLCQDRDRRRYFLARAINDPSHPDAVFETVPVSALLDGEYRFDELRSVRLSNGETFSFGPHGEWFTEAETLADKERIKGKRGWASMPWYNGTEPRLPEK